MEKTPLSAREAFVKAAAYCAYQERCHQEVREKLASLGLAEEDQEEILERLRNEKYLDEARFAMAFAGGKFRVKQWGRIKIRYALLQKEVPESLIKKALAQIAPGDYYDTLYGLARQKLAQAGDKDREPALYSYLASKGYESDIIREVMEDIKREEKNK